MGKKKMDTLPRRQDLSNSHIIQEENISTLGQVELGTYQGTRHSNCSIYFWLHFKTDDEHKSGNQQ